MSILFLMLGLGKNEHVHKSVHDQVAHFVNFRQPDHRIHDYSQKAERPHPQSAQIPVYKVNFKIHKILTIVVIFIGPTDWTSTSGRTEGAGIQTDRLVASDFVCGYTDEAEEIVTTDNVGFYYVILLLLIFMLLLYWY